MVGTLFLHTNPQPKGQTVGLIRIRGKRYEVEKKLWGGDRGNQYTQEASGNIYHLAKSNQRTGEDLASEYGVLTHTRLDYQNQQDDNNKCFPCTAYEGFD